VNSGERKRSKRRSAMVFSTLLASVALLVAVSSVSTTARVENVEHGPKGDRVYALVPPDAVKHDIGPLKLHVTNIGQVGNVYFDEPSATWGDGQYLYLGGLWIGAIASDNLPYVSTALYEAELRPSLEKVDRMYLSYEGIPHGNRVGFSEHADDDGDGLTDEDLQNGKDDDGDGRIDEDFSAWSEQMYCCEYWDYTEEAGEAYPEHRPLGLMVRQRSFAWSIPGVDEFVGVDYEITNDLFETLRSVYLGLFVDGDAGPFDPPPGWYADDGGAFLSMRTTLVDPTLSECDSLPVLIQMAYTYDVPDGEEGAGGGDADGFFGALLLGCTIDPSGRKAPTAVRVKTARFFHGSGSYPFGDPSNDFERYDALSSGIHQIATREPGDYRMLLSVGPFDELVPGEKLRLEVAFVVGEGYYDPLTNTPHPELGHDGAPSTRSLVANALRARLAYEGRWKDIDGLPWTGIDGRETCIPSEPGDSLVYVPLCDSLGDSQVLHGTCEDAESWVDNDCNPCTPNTAHEGCAEGGCETLVHWYIPPATASVESGASDPHSSRIGMTILGQPADAPLRCRLDLAEPATLVMRIHDAGGREIRNLGARSFPRGSHVIAWDGRDNAGRRVASGVYYLRSRADRGHATGRIVLLDR
jgi:hypothetical protein